eukprot:gene27079-33749_t
MSFLSSTSTQKSTILVTGGGTGIGLALSTRLADLGHTVIIAGRRQAQLDEAKAAHPKLKIVQGDIGSDASRIALFEKVTKEFPAVNVLINNAGVFGPMTPIKDVGVADWKAWKDVIEINVTGNIHMSTLFIPHFLTKPFAYISNVSSVLAFFPFAGAPVYSASKAALHSFTISLRHQLKDTNIRVTEITPPLVETDMSKGMPGALDLNVYADDTIRQILDDVNEISYEGKYIRFNRDELDAAFNGFNGVGTGGQGSALAINGDGGSATAAKLYCPYQIYGDSAGANIYFTDFALYRVRVVSLSTGIIMTYAGRGSSTSFGDGGLATSAGFIQPYGLSGDSVGNIYIGDNGSGGDRIRRVDPITRIITAFWGAKDTYGSSGDGGTVTSARAFSPQHMYTDTSGRMYVCDAGNFKIRSVDFATNIVSLVAGTGNTLTVGDKTIAAATSTALFKAFGIWGSYDGTVYFSEYDAYWVKQVDPSNQLTSVIVGTGIAGVPTAINGDGGQATSGALLVPLGLGIDTAGNMFIADSFTNRIRRVTHVTAPMPFTSSPSISPSLIPSAMPTLSPNPTLQPTLQPTVVPTGGLTKLTTVVGIGGTTKGSAGDGGQAVDATLSTSRGVWLDSNGNLYLTDAGSYRIRKVDAVTGIITLVCGLTLGATGDGGQASSARVSTPTQIFGDAASANGKNAVVATAGDGGRATSASFNGLNGVAGDTLNNIYLSETGGARIRRVDALTNIISTFLGFAGAGGTGFQGDGGPASSAKITNSYQIHISADNRLFITENNKIRVIGL